MLRLDVDGHVYVNDLHIDASIVWLLIVYDVNHLHIWNCSADPYALRMLVSYKEWHSIATGKPYCKDLLSGIYRDCHTNLLEISNLDLSPQDIDNLTTNTSLVSLRLWVGNVDANGLRLLARHESLQTLVLASVPLGTEEVSVLCNSTCLTDLTLQNCCLTDEGAIALASNTHIKYLSMPENPLTDACTTVFSTNTTILMLEIDSSGITDAGARELAKNTTITDLGLEFTEISEEGVKALLLNSTIEALTVCGRVDDPLSDEIAIQLAHSTTLTWLHLQFQEEGFGLEVARAFAANTRLDALYINLPEEAHDLFLRCENYVQLEIGTYKAPQIEGLTRNNRNRQKKARKSTAVLLTLIAGIFSKRRTKRANNAILAKIPCYPDGDP